MAKSWPGPLTRPTLSSLLPPLSLPHSNSARALLVIAFLTFLSVSSQLITLYTLSDREQHAIAPTSLPIPGNDVNSTTYTTTTATEAEAEETKSKRPQAQIGRVYMNYGSGAEEGGVILDDFYNEAMQLHLAYDEAHGYPSFVLERDVYEGVWNKIVFLATIVGEELMKEEDERLEWLCWTDRDIVLLNPLLPLSIFLPPTTTTDHFATSDLLISCDFNALNAGIFLLRISHWSYTFLSQIIAFRSYFPSTDLYWAEQSAIIALLADHPEYIEDGNVRYVPQYWFNAYEGPRREEEGWRLDYKDEEYNYTRQGAEGVMNVHFPGGEKRKMGRYLEIARRHEREWEVPLDRLNLEAEIERFWKEEEEGMVGRCL